MGKNSNTLKMNDAIQDSTILLIGADGTKYGVVTRKEALDIAREKELDLILVSESNGKKPCVCKLQDYSKLKYLKSKKNKHNKSNYIVKEIRINYNIFEHDLQTKHKHVTKFLLKHYKVKYILQIKGRQRYKVKKEELLKRCNEFLDDFDE